MCAAHKITGNFNGFQITKLQRDNLKADGQLSAGADLPLVQTPHTFVTQYANDLWYKFGI